MRCVGCYVCYIIFIFRSNKASTSFTTCYHQRNILFLLVTQLVINMSSQLVFFLVFLSSHDWKARLNLPPVDTRYRTEV